MRAGYLEAAGKAVFRTDMPEPMIEKADQVKIRVKVCGICGSEVHALHGLHPFRIPPVVSGHEFAGDVVEIGSAVTACKVGDRVTAEPQYGCGECVYCKEGKYNVCTAKHVLGSNGWSGPMGEYVVVPEKTIVKLADSVSYEEGAMIEPIANGMYAVRRANITETSTICIIGCGPIGLGDYLAAKLYNPKLVIMADISDYNLKIAEEYGCTCTVNNKREDLYEKVMELTNGDGVDMVFLGYGDGPTINLAAKITKRCGVIHQHALMLDGIEFPYQIHQQHELSFIAYNMYKYEEFEIICKAIAEGKISGLDKMITHRFPIEKYSEAMYMADKRPEPVVKVILTF